MTAVQSRKRMPSMMAFLNMALTVLSNRASSGNMYIRMMAYATTATRKTAVATVQKAFSNRMW